MIRPLAAAALGALASALASAAAACPDPSATLLFHSCWAGGNVEIRLLPEDLPLPAPDSGTRLIVTGAYTSTESRNGDLSKPVGLFVHRGKVVNPNLGRMDGILLVDPKSGKPDLQSRAVMRYDGNSYDLRKLDQRHAFVDAARDADISVLQSHLLIVDGRVDVRPQDDAPVFLRRILFSGAQGFGIYQTAAPATLYDAARALADAHAPEMALNLDMGSYDYCQRQASGTAKSCGLLGADDTAKLSNILVLQAP
ncbi:MAG: hypothetical protein OEN23_05585 [Paracoccaceae bacterium]|nr:hypothetical protein [Paracoccaceae bacterium]